jgi:hypothetical protein
MYQSRQLPKGYSISQLKGKILRYFRQVVHYPDEAMSLSRRNMVSVAPSPIIASSTLPTVTRPSMYSTVYIPMAQTVTQPTQKR